MLAIGGAHAAQIANRELALVFDDVGVEMRDGGQ